MSQHVRNSWYVPEDAGPRWPFCGEPPGPISEPICVHYVARRDPSRYRIAGSYTLTRRLWDVWEKFRRLQLHSQNDSDCFYALQELEHDRRSLYGAWQSGNLEGIGPELTDVDGFLYCAEPRQFREALEAQINQCMDRIEEFVDWDELITCPFCGEPGVDCEHAATDIELGGLGEWCGEYEVVKEVLDALSGGLYFEEEIEIEQLVLGLDIWEGIVRHASIEGGYADEYIFEKMPVFQLRGKAFEAGFGTSMTICFVDPDLKDRMLSQARELLKRIDEHYA